MNCRLHISIALMVVALVGCSQKPVVIDPTVVSSNYDYVKPVDVAEQSKPVWILPLINTGWIPAYIDPKTGDWVGGHYQATVVQPGYWATLEEAELAGRPYIVAGEGKPVIPVPPSEVGPSSGGVNPELDIVGLQKKVEALESRVNQPPVAAGDQDQLAALAAQVSALAAQANVTSSIATDVPVVQNTQGYRPEIMVNALPGSAPGPLNTASYPPPYQNTIYNNDLPQQISTANESTLILPPKPPGTAFELNPDSGNQKISVRYLENNQVQLNYNGKTYNVKMRNPDDKIRVTIPKR